MSIPASTKVGNRLLSRLPTKARAAIMAHAKVVPLESGMLLCEADGPLKQVYFPLSGYISQVISIGDHPPLQIGLIGTEGMLGATLALDIDAAPMSAIVQGPGSALRISAVGFQRLLRAHPMLARTVKRYLYTEMEQLSQTNACTRFHQVNERLARWLLMTHDRAVGDYFHLTHQSLADMLGVRRSGVTIAAGMLQGQHLIDYTRGEIHILNRRGLESMSCECYRVIIDDYARWFA